MGVAVVFLLVIAGVLLIPAYPLAGVAVLASGYCVSKLAGGRSEDIFVAALMILGGLGALAETARFFIAMP